MNRRAFLLSTAAATLAACSTTGSSPPDAQVLADVQGLIPVLQNILTAVQTDAPNAIPSDTMAKITALSASAQTALASFANATTTAGQGASLATIEQYLNAALDAVGSALPGAAKTFPALAQYVPMYQAAVALVTLVIEPYLNTLVPGAATMHAHAALKYTPEQARKILKIK